MPQVTNPFQAMVKRIEAALQGTSVRVEGSALVENHVTGKRDEIDVLISIEIGGRELRIGVACQDRSRPAGPTWIRELANQRDELRLDRSLLLTQ